MAPEETERFAERHEDEVGRAWCAYCGDMPKDS